MVRYGPATREGKSRVTVDHCLRAFERRRISDGKSPRKSFLIFPLVWQDHMAAEAVTMILYESK